MNFQAEKDRRDSIRFDFVSDVIVRTEDGTKTIKGKLVNLAMGGLALRFQHRFEWLALFHVYQTKSAA